MSEVYDKEITFNAIGDTFGRIMDHMKVGENVQRVRFSERSFSVLIVTRMVFRCGRNFLFVVFACRNSWSKFTAAVPLTPC